MENAKQRSSGMTGIANGDGWLAFRAVQMLALAGIVASYWVPSPFGMAAAVTAGAVALGLGVRHPEAKGRFVQLTSAVVALIAVSMLFVEGRAARGPVVTAEREPIVAVSKPVVAGGHEPPELKASPAPVVAGNDDWPPSPAAAAASTGAPGEHEPAGDFAGVPLPDMGEGTPFEKVAMTKVEMKLFEQLFLEFWSSQRELQDRMKRGELDLDAYQSVLKERGDALSAELEAAMGKERVGILLDELNRYYLQLALSDSTPEIDSDKLAESDIYQKFNHLVAQPE